MDSKKKIVIITAWPSTYRVDLFKYIMKTYEEYDIHVIFSSTESRMAVNIECESNFHTLSSKLITKNKKMDGWYIIVSYGLSKILSEIKPDVVVGSEYNLTIQEALMWSKFHRVPYICWSDATEVSERELSMLQKIFRRNVIHNAKRFIASSTRTKELLVKYGADEEKVKISYLTVNIDNFLQSRTGVGNKLIYVGSLIHRKGVDLLIQTIAKMREECVLDIVGWGTNEEIEKLNKLCKELDVQNKVHFLGQKTQDELKRLYAEHNIFVLATREDCYGLVILEAMCSSLPVVVSKYADGVVDLIDEGINGYVVNPENIDEFAKILDLLIVDYVKQKEMGNFSYKKAKQFSFENVAKPFMEQINAEIRKGTD